MTLACRLVLSNSVPDHNAFAFSRSANLYEVRADGTLWEQDLYDRFDGFLEPHARRQLASVREAIGLGFNLGWRRHALG